MGATSKGGSGRRAQMQVDRASLVKQEVTGGASRALGRNPTEFLFLKNASRQPAVHPTLCPGECVKAQGTGRKGLVARQCRSSGRDGGRGYIHIYLGVRIAKRGPGAVWDFIYPTPGWAWRERGGKESRVDRLSALRRRGGNWNRDLWWGCLRGV